MFTHAGIVLAVIASAFIAARFLRLNVELSMLVGALAGALVHAKGLPVRHLVEGSFTYFDMCLIFITATVFINLVKEAGGIAFMVRSIVARFYNHRVTCLVLLTFIMMIPGSLTGAGAATVITVGTLVGTVLFCMGVSKTRTLAIVYLCSIMSAAAPPVNLWAMMAAAGSNMPYVGFMLPLLLLTVTGALLSMFILAGKGKEINVTEALSKLPMPPEKMSWPRVLFPFIVFFGLVVAGRIWPFEMPIMGLPLMFLLASAATVLISPKKLNIVEIAASSIRSLIPLVGIMIVVGILIQVMALSGARGLISLGVVTLPLTLLFASLFIILPVSEGLLQYAAAPLLGVPLVLLFNMKGLDPVLALSAMAVMWPVGDCLPPTAVVGRAAVIELEYKGAYYKEFVKTCAFPAACILFICTMFIIFSKELSFLAAG